MTQRFYRLATAAGFLLASACSSLTDVDSPDVVQPEQLANAAGAEALTSGALASIMSPFMTFAYNTGIFSDEFKFATAFISQADIDFRSQSLTFTEYGPILMHRVRTQTQQAIESRRQFAPTRLGLLLFICLLPVSLLFYRYLLWGIFFEVGLPSGQRVRLLCGYDA